MARGAAGAAGVAAVAGGVARVKPAAENEAGGIEDFGDEGQPQVIIANGSQPEFDFDDQAPAAKPARSPPR